MRIPTQTPMRFPIVAMMEIPSTKKNEKQQQYRIWCLVRSILF